MAERKPSEREAPSKADMAERMRLASLDGSEAKPVSTPTVEVEPTRTTTTTTTTTTAAPTPKAK